MRGGTSVQDSPAALASSYDYNVRDWLTGIDGPLFSETLFYETKRTGNTLPKQWGGNISSAKWKTALAPSDSTWYDYGYDKLGRLTEAKFGCSAGAQSDYGRSYTYDLNGNMELRHAYDLSPLVVLNRMDRVWTWTSSDGNRPSEWTQNDFQEAHLQPMGPGNAVPLGNTGYTGNTGGAGVQSFGGGLLLDDEMESYAYDSVGNRTAVLDAQDDTLSVMRYNLLALPEEFITSEGKKMLYVYSADGEKLLVQSITAANDTTGTEYAANNRLEDGSLTMIHTDAGYYTPVTPPSGAGSPSYEHIWYLKDHLGNNRVLADGSGNALRRHNYDPFGIQITLPSESTVPFPSGATESPYMYGGKEWNTTTSTYDFEARQFAPAFHRFTTLDPLAEKYYGISPYVYCADNPVNLTDPDGNAIRIRRNSADALTDLARIAATRQGSNILSGLAKSKDTYSLEPVLFSWDAVFTGKNINYVTHPIMFADFGSPSEFVYMGHELKHASDHDNGKIPVNRYGEAVSLPRAESSAVSFENYLRSVYGIPFLRKGYSGFVKGENGFNPITYRTKGERIKQFKKIDSNEEGTAYGYSYVRTYRGNTSTEYIIVGIDDNSEFYYKKYATEEEYQKAISEW